MLERLVERLLAGKPDKEAVIALARARAAAVEAAPVLMQLCEQTSDPTFRCICLDALGAILHDSTHAHARACADRLAGMIEDARYKRIRRRIALTLGEIGRSAVVALPALVRVLYSGVRGSVRVPAKWAIFRITWYAVHDGAVQDRRDGLAAVAGMSRPYAEWFTSQFSQSDELSECAAEDVQVSLRKIRESRRGRVT
ncbi:MAG: hypothetical protein AMXMBFR47_30440 [Planctomycetota bacterium]